MQAADLAIGQIMDFIRSTPELAENTLVFLSSDNGPSLIRKEFGGSPGQLRCGKGTTYEGGQRVPGVAWWPSRISPFQISDKMASSLDIFATLLSIAGVDSPTGRPIDSRDLSPILFQKNSTAIVRDNFFFYGLTGKLHALRVNDYKAHW